MQSKNFSVLMSIYKKENPLWFREALDSVFAQTLQPSEIVLVKDGPLTPELDAVINEYNKNHPIFNIVINKTNLGLGIALQRGVLACSNEIIARMDTDDIIPAYRFEKQLVKIEEGYDVVSCWSMIFREKIDNVISVKKRPERHAEIVKLAHKRSPICHAAAFMRKSAIISAGNYQDRQFCEDYHLWIRMMINGAKFYNIQQVLYYVRTTPGQMERRGGVGYLKKELTCFMEIKKMGFYSRKDIFVNSIIRIVVRLTPPKLRTAIYKRIWNHKSSIK